MSCYLGDNPTDWKNHVDSINSLHIDVFPTVLKKGSDEEFIGVHPNFPRIFQIDKKIDETHSEDTRIKNVIEDNYISYNFIEQALLNDHIDSNTGLRDELSALVIYRNTRGLLSMLNQRILCDDKHHKLKQRVLELIELEFNNTIQLKRLKYETVKDLTKKAEHKTDLMETYERFETAQASMMNSRDEFYKVSKDCANLEKKDFNLKFNANFFINFHSYMSGCTIRSMTIVTYLSTQRELWADLLKGITVKVPIESQGEESLATSPSVGYKEVKRFEQRLNLLQKLNSETEQSIDTMNLIDLQLCLKDLENQRTSLQEMVVNWDPDDPEVKDDTIRKSRNMIKEVSSKIEEKQLSKKLLDDTKRQEVNTNIKALGTVKMTVLTGFEDYLAWRKSQKYLNSHTDPFKKGATLLSTLKNDQDVARCAGIYDYDVLMKILEQKYSHQEKLIPSMLNRLRKLGEPTEESTMLSNIGMILNIHSQLAEMSEVAISRFDSTVIEDLVLKLTHRVQMDWEEYLILHEQSPISDELHESMYKDNQSVISGEGLELKREPLDSNIEESRRKRVLFITFLKRKETIIQNMKARKITINPQQHKKKCKTCKNELGKCKCPKFKSSKVQNYQVSTETKCCPVCNAAKMHLSARKKPTSSLSACPKFKQMTLEGRKDMVRKCNACFVCLQTNAHSAKDCFIQNNCRNCNRSRHHPFICNEQKRFNPNKTFVPAFDKGKRPQAKASDLPTIVETEEVHAVQSSKNNSILAVSSGMVLDHTRKGFRYLSMLWDTASTAHFIKNDIARRYGYSGYPTMVNIGRLGLKPEHIRCYKYFVTLKDRNGKTYKIEALGVPRIGQKKKIETPFLMHLAKQFDIGIDNVDNVEGEIHILLGLSDFAIFPKHFRTVDEYPNLALLQSEIGKPFIFVGSIDGINGKQISCHFIDVHSKDYWMGDQLGLNLEPKCRTCLKAPPCKQCRVLNMPITFREQEESEVIRNTLTFDYENKEVRVTYPYLRNIWEIFAPNKTNRPLAEKMAITLKKSLEKDNLLHEYTENSFLEMEGRGAIRELSQEEMDEWESAGNPINYCSHHAVLKDSKTTKCRSVCNSSLSHNGTTLNASLPKGPSALTNLLHVLMRFRSKPYLVISDLTKAYNSIKTSPLECHLRRLLWYRTSDFQEENPKLRTFGMVCMAFGDTPAAYYLECSKEEIANYIRTELKNDKLADDVISCSYVDDFAIPLESLEEAKKYGEDIPKAFEVLGFKIKHIYVGGQNVKPNKIPESNQLFGHIYDMVTDTIQLKFTVNFSRKRRSQRVAPNLTSESDLSKFRFTKRMMLSLMASQFDPLGLVSCFLAKYKIFLAQIFKKGYDWDSELDEEDQKKACRLVKEMIKGSESNLSFVRSNKPKSSFMERIICFVDASSVSLQVALYGVYTTEQGEMHTSLLTAKNRIANFTVPKNELNSLVAGHRLVLNFLEAVPEAELVKDICFISDSTCSLDCLSPKYVTKDVFIINRISEIRKSARKMNKVVKYYWINSSQNIADFGTRENCTLEFLFSDLWQKGPEFIKDLENSPAVLKLVIDSDGVITKTITLDDNPDIQQAEEVLTAATFVSKSETIWEKLLNRSNDLKKVLRAFCLVRSCLTNKSFLVKKFATVAEMNYAFLFFIKLAQKELPPEDLKAKQLVTFKQDGVIWTQMRFPTTLMLNIFGKDKLPVISGKTRFAKILLAYAHATNSSCGKGSVHNGIRQTLINSRVGIYGTYTTHAKQCIRNMIRGCAVCRRSEKLIQNAQMGKNTGGFGEIPKNYSPFNSLAMDYFGPFWAMPPKTRETRIRKKYKVYGMILLCLHTRAIKVLPVEGYDQESFLTAFKIHCSNHGIPSQIVSDPMSSFLAGAKSIGKTIEDEIDEDAKPDKRKFNFEENLTHAYNIDWKFILPGSQFRDPAERSVKSVKELMYSIFNSEHNRPCLTLNEYWCIFSDVCEILNRRPIQGVMSEDMLQFVCPNQLLFGRSSKDPPLSLPDNLETKPRLELMDSIKQEFWKCLMDTLAADSQLMKYPCWYKQSSKPAKGDVVLVLYKSKVIDNYRIGLVDDVSLDGRDLDLFVSPIQDSSKYNFKQVRKMRVPIQRTILIYSPKHD